MKRILDLQCKACGMVVRRWVEVSDIEKEPCPNCSKKEMEWRLPEYPSASSCGIKHRGFSI